VADASFGMPLINVGTGGRGHASFISNPVANSAVRDKTSWGVLKLTLHPDSFDYAFLPAANGAFTDVGTGACHDKPEGGPVEPPPGGPALTFGADADTYVAKKAPNTNYGSKATLLTDVEPMNGAYLKFTVSGVEGTVTGARLRLWVANGTANGPTLYPTDASWSEPAVTWNNRPVRTGAAVDDLGSVKAGQFVELDVSGVVAGNGTFSFELAPASKDGADFASGEATNADRRPQLLLAVAVPASVEAG
jgi:hypothetical protein